MSRTQDRRNSSRVGPHPARSHTGPRTFRRNSSRVGVMDGAHRRVRGAHNTNSSRVAAVLAVLP
ncbi:hypothetical protein F4553_006805 [Allocatelliglobosispora scoriae]|uniref:Uncharacterized protein n=1 Tax=Allocatelliglobosispora scoriae TaxID=643052 RepID=A0A841C3F6_9ACTN|nr:hypothetical protein [Allocatelliglobosispora scoriae]MBB5873371.1 hypothetical protein [Allocatelliglobosispora scoriae]